MQSPSTAPGGSASGASTSDAQLQQDTTASLDLRSFDHQSRSQVQCIYVLPERPRCCWCLTHCPVVPIRGLSQHTNCTRYRYSNCHSGPLKSYTTNASAIEGPWEVTCMCHSSLSGSCQGDCASIWLLALTIYPQCCYSQAVGNDRRHADCNLLPCRLPKLLQL